MVDANIIAKRDGYIDIYMVDFNSTNVPSMTFGVLISLSYNALYGQQYILANSGIYRRVYNNDNFEEWQLLT